MIRMELSEAEAKLEELIDSGETVILTRDGVSVARLVPLPRQPERDPEAIRRAVEEIRALAKGNRLDGLSIKELIDEGRR